MRVGCALSPNTSLQRAEIHNRSGAGGRAHVPTGRLAREAILQWRRVQILTEPRYNLSPDHPRSK